LIIDRHHVVNPFSVVVDYHETHLINASGFGGQFRSPIRVTDDAVLKSIADQRISHVVQKSAIERSASKLAPSLTDGGLNFQTDGCTTINSPRLNLACICRLINANIVGAPYIPQTYIYIGTCPQSIRITTRGDELEKVENCELGKK